MSNGTLRRRLGAIAVVVLAGLLIGTQAALAAGGVPPTKVKGTIGKWSLAESVSDPSVTCIYAHRPTALYKHKLAVVEVRAPKVFWPNRRVTWTKEHGKVSWRLRIMERTASGWRAVYNSGNQKAEAFENSKAPLVQVGLDWNKRGDHLYYFQHRITWYRKDGSVLGMVRTWSQRALNQDGFVDGVLKPASCRNRYKDPYP